MLFIFTIGVTASCGGGGGGSSSGGGGTSGGGGGSTPLVSGTFIKSFAPTVTGDNAMPFGSGSFGDVRHQVVYTAAEVGAAGQISAIRFQYVATLGAAVTCPNTTVRLGHTSLSALTTTFANNINRSSPQTIIDNATVTIPAGSAGNWFTIVLATPFNYNGVDNLVVEIERTTACNGNVYIAIVNAADNRRAESNAADTTAGSTQHDTVTADYADIVHPLQQFVFSGGDDRVLYGGVSANAIPFAQSNLPELRHAQLLYHASEIAGSGPITGIAFIVGQQTTANDYVVTVRLGHTTLSALTDTFAANFNSGAPVTVASNLSFKVPAGILVGRPIWIPLSGAFSYNGTDNLIVDIEVTGPFAASTFIRAHGSLAGRRLYAAVGAATGAVDNQGGYDTYFRFHGATMDVMLNIGNVASTQVLGSGSSGQIQSLYDAVRLGTGGSITNMAVQMSTASDATTVPNVKIYIGHTTKTALAITDSYASNMDNATLVYSGSLNVPAGLQQGDWLTIPLITPFAYDPTRNLTVLFTSDQSPSAFGANWVSMHSDAIEFPNHAVYRPDNAVDTNGMPQWSLNGALNIRFRVQK